MAKPTIQTGAHSTLVYYWEDDGFKSTTNTTPKSFGKDAQLSAFDGARNAVEAFDPDSREVAEWIEQEFSGSWTADFTMGIGNPWWNRAVLDTPSTSGAEAPYTHDFTGEQPSSLQIVTGNTRSGEDWLLQGASVANATISIEVPGNITVSLDGGYSALEETEPTEQEAQVTHDTDPAVFKNATLSIGGTVQRLIQSLTFTIANNTDPVYELGSDTSVDFSPKGRTLTVDYAQTRDDQSDDAIDRFLGGGSTIDTASRNELVIDIDNGDTGASRESLGYTLSSSLTDEFSIGGTGDVDSNIENSLTDRPVGVEAVAENPTEEAL